MAIAPLADTAGNPNGLAGAIGAGVEVICVNQSTGVTHFTT